MEMADASHGCVVAFCYVFIVTMLRTNKVTLWKGWELGFDEDTTAQAHTLQEPTDDFVVLLLQYTILHQL